MNIFSIIRKKPAENICIFIFLVYLGILLFCDRPALAGVGFLVLWLLSFITTNAVFCVLGAFISTVLFTRMAVVKERFEATCPFLPGEVPTLPAIATGTGGGGAVQPGGEEPPGDDSWKYKCFAMTTDYEQKIIVMTEQADILKIRIESLETDLQIDKANYAVLQSSTEATNKKNVQLLDIVNTAHSMSK